MKILVVDDDEVFMNLIAFKLRKEGNYEIFTALDGKRAQHLVQEVHPDIVITDVLMPFASGLELIEFIRNTMKSDTFIVAISTVGLEMAMQEAYEMGADDFMAKPFNLEELLIKIKNMSPINHHKP